MDWVEHRLTPEHLIRMSEILADKTGGSGKLKLKYAFVSLYKLIVVYLK